MAKHRIFTADQPVGTSDAPEVSVSAACETGRCGRCRGEVLSLLVEPGTRCGHDCHREGVAA